MTICANAILLYEIIIIKKTEDIHGLSRDLQATSMLVL
jgi:hypothetical protein